MTHQLLFWSIFSHIYYDKPWELTNNGKVASDISIRYQYREGVDPLTRKEVAHNITIIIKNNPIVKELVSRRRRLNFGRES
jgi:hypothetical protein